MASKTFGKYVVKQYPILARSESGLVYRGEETHASIFELADETGYVRFTCAAGEGWDDGRPCKTLPTTADWEQYPIKNS